MKTMRKIMLLLALSLPFLGFTACSENEELPIESKDIESPILAFYETEEFIRQGETRKLLRYEAISTSDKVKIIFQGASNAKYIAYEFYKNELNIARVVYEDKDEQHLMDYINEQYNVIDKAYNSITFESKDMLIRGRCEVKNESIVVSYFRNYTREEESTIWAEPILAWGASSEYIKNNEVRPFIREENGTFIFSNIRYMGIVGYRFSTSDSNLKLTDVVITDIPALHFEKIMSLFDKDYESVKPIEACIKSYLSKDKKTRVDVQKFDHSFSLYYHSIK